MVRKTGERKTGNAAPEQKPSYGKLPKSGRRGAYNNLPRRLRRNGKPMSEHPIEGLMDTTLEHIKEIMDVNTVIGDQITTPDGTVIIPVSRISLGYASGGSDFGKTERQKFGGGGGAGGTIVPVAFLVVSNGNVKLLQISQSNGAADKAVSLVPELFDKITTLFGKGKKNKDGKDSKNDLSQDAVSQVTAAAENE